MVFGYNGLGRFGEVTADDTAYRSFTPPFSGSPSALRLLNEALATQIGWMLPTAVVAVVVLFVLRFRMPLTVFATARFVTFAAMFSGVAGMHQFYTASLAIPAALLIGTAFALAAVAACSGRNLRYALAGSAGSLGGAGGAGRGGGDDTTTSAEIRAWVLENCTAVTDAAASGIYDCTP